MTSVLISGAEQPVERLASALRDAGADVTTVTDLGDVAGTGEPSGEAAFDAYVQLPSTFQMSGDTVIERVHAFYADGVLARFPAMRAALPALRPDAKLIFSLGQLSSEVASQDDRDARLSLTKVLVHAARADRPDAAFAVQVLDYETPIDEVVGTVLGTAPAPRSLLETMSDLTYADWRVEVLGLVALDT